ncbi:MAG: superoxide dismutase [Ni] [Verrucomicrobiota bacterium]
MKNQLITALASITILAAPQLSAHCQVPCGIFDNDNVIQSIHTDWVTIDKAAKQIAELSKDPSANAHQLTRWILNKESHAQDIQEKMLNYFLAQRLKLPADEAAQEAYLKNLKLCHEIIIAAMKCKQTTEPEAIEKLHVLLHQLEDAFGSK